MQVLTGVPILMITGSLCPIKWIQQNNAELLLHVSYRDIILGGIIDSISNSAYCNRRIRVSPSVCLSITLVHPAKAVGRNEMPFGGDTAGVVPSNIVLEKGPVTQWKGRFGGRNSILDL